MNHNQALAIITAIIISFLVGLFHVTKTLFFYLKFGYLYWLWFYIY